jgi:eukaryotic-like serine/threonine-protein kinase
MSVDDNSQLKPGQKVATYEIVTFISRGGMGEVYLAIDRRLNRKVALKFLPTCFMDDADRLRRFQHEALLASALNHPNILTIHEIGEAEGHRFIVTEFVDGETLGQRMARGPLPIDEALQVAEQIASALGAAHAEGIVHRDIKPDNVMLRRDGIVKILDLGLAKLTETKQSGAEDQTRALLRTSPGIVMGTISYMSPEQARGLPVDARTDLWSFGVVIYEMLTGRTPFNGETTSDVIVSILEREPPPLSGLPALELQCLQPLVSRALAKDRESRYQLACEMRDDIHRLKQTFENSSVTDSTAAGAVTEVLISPDLEAPSPTTSEIPATHETNKPSPEGLKRSSIPKWVVLSVLAAFLISLVSFFYWPRLSTPPLTSQVIDSLAVLPLANSSGDVERDYLSDGITESLISSLSELNLKVMSRNSVFRFKGKEIDAQTVAKQLGVRGILSGDVRQVDDQFIINIEIIDAKDGSVVLSRKYVRKTSDLLAMQASIAQDVANKLRVKLSTEDQQHLAKLPTTNPEAYQFYLRGLSLANKTTPESLHQAIKFYQQAVDLDPNYALAYAQIGQAYLILGIYFERPREMMPNARLYCSKALQLDSSLADAHITAGTVDLLYDWDFDGAQRELSSNEGIDPKAVETFSCSAHILESVGRGKDAEKEIRRALGFDPLSVPLNTELGCTSYYSRQFDSSISENQEVLQLDPANPLAYWGLARAFGQKKMYEEALAELKKAQRTAGPALPLIVAESGYVYAASGRKKEALEIIKQLDNMGKQVFVDPYLIASVYAGLGDKEKALTSLESAVEIRSSFITSMQAEPKFDSLRTDPRFISMLQRIGFKT